MTAGYLQKDDDWWYGRTGYGRYSGRPDLSFGELNVTYNYLNLPNPIHICEQSPEYAEFWVMTQNTKWAGLHCYVNGTWYAQFASTGNIVTKTKWLFRRGSSYTIEVRRS